MNRFLFSLAALSALLFFSCSSNQNGYKISGTISNINPGTKIFFDEMEYNKVTTLDTTVSGEKGQFHFEGFLSHEGLYRVRYGKDYSVFLVLNKTSNEIEIKADTFNLFEKPYSVSGSASSTQFLNFFLEVKNIYQGISDINTRMSDTSHSVTDSTRAQLMNQMQTATDNGRKWLNNYVDTSTNPVIAVFAMSNFLNPEMDKKTFENFVLKSKTKYADIPMVKMFCDDVELAFKKMERKPGESLYGNGTQMPEINIPNLSGKSISLSSLKGKYVLVDFWASWCGPCRHENPNVVAAYEKYKDKGFTVYSISLDDDKEKWKKAIEQDHLSWEYHVSELKGWESDVVHQFGIESIPANYLIDKEGKIIASGLRGKELENILEQTIK